jgi:hypothetical protein
MPRVPGPDRDLIARHVARLRSEAESTLVQLRRSRECMDQAARQNRMHCTQSMQRDKTSNPA